jgi:hypothetical protein
MAAAKPAAVPSGHRRCSLAAAVVASAAPASEQVRSASVHCACAAALRRRTARHISSRLPWLAPAGCGDAGGADCCLPVAMSNIWPCPAALSTVSTRRGTPGCGLSPSGSTANWCPCHVRMPAEPPGSSTCGRVTSPVAGFCQPKRNPTLPPLVKLTDSRSCDTAPPQTSANAAVAVSTKRGAIAKGCLLGRPAATACTAATASSQQPAAHELSATQKTRLRRNRLRSY